MKQLIKVKTGEIDQQEGGPEYEVHYVLFETVEDTGREDDGCILEYHLYIGDGDGNATLVAKGNSLKRMRSLTLALGEFVEWEEKKQ